MQSQILLHHHKKIKHFTSKQSSMSKQSSLFSSAATLVLTVISSTQAAFSTTASRHLQQRSRPSALTAFQQSHLLDKKHLFTTANCNPPRVSDVIQSPALHQRQAFTRFFSTDTTKSSSTDNQEIMNEAMLLPYVDGSHNSVKIAIEESNTEFTNMDKDTFKERLQVTIKACTKLQKSSLWISIPMSHASLIESMNDIPGLEFHNASGKLANLSIWLLRNIENKIPEYATHQVGVGAMVVNSKNEILCVRELKKNYRPWKIPGGLAELGENLDVAAIREVKEETGIDCTFKSVLTFRHTHGMQFNRSDFYFVCRLEPIEGRDEETDRVIIPEPVAQEGEIAAAKWVPFDEYRTMVNGDNPHPMMQKVLELYDSENDIKQSVIHSIVPGRKPSPIYHAP